VNGGERLKPLHFVHQVKDQASKQADGLHGQSKTVVDVCGFYLAITTVEDFQSRLQAYIYYYQRICSTQPHFKFNILQQLFSFNLFFEKIF